MRADYVIVGAGSAGAVLANRLSAHASVILIEAGPVDHLWDFRLHMPAALSEVLATDRYNWFYHSTPEADLNCRPLYCPRGRVLGGSSSINGMIYVRGHPADFDHWAEDPALGDWNYDQCLPYFKRAERCGHGDAEYRGDGGPMVIGRGAATGALNESWLAAGEQAGYRLSSDFNGANQEGVGVFDCTIHKGQRLSTARAYLHPVLARRRLQVVTNALVSRVIVDGDVARGVEFMEGGASKRATADAEVILCCGAINSPQLLLLSGIGPADHLADFDIPVVADLPGVGANLQDHLEVYLQYACRQPVSLYPATRWYRKPLVGLDWYLRRQGPGASNHFETGAFLRSSEQIAYPDLQFHFLPVAMNYDGSEQFAGHGFQVHVGPMKPMARGRVQLASADPGHAPTISFNYHSVQADREVMFRGIEIARKIVSQSAFQGLRGKEIHPGAVDPDTFVRSRAESAYHPCGTCPMGSDEFAVVDGQARVRGVSGLRVVDASIMPEITNGNLNAPVIMLAEKLSETF